MRALLLACLVACSSNGTTTPSPIDAPPAGPPDAPLPADARPPAADAGGCGAGAIPCGPTTCAADHYCALDWPGTGSPPPDGGTCPSWCFNGGPGMGCFCPQYECVPLPASCTGCNCVGTPPNHTCPGPGWECDCYPGGGLVLDCYEP